MDDLITLANMARIIPFALVVYIGFIRGYRWLSLAALNAILVAVLVPTVHPPEYIRASIASITAFAIMMHALRLNKRQGGDE